MGESDEELLRFVVRPPGAPDMPSALYWTRDVEGGHAPPEARVQRVVSDLPILRLRLWFEHGYEPRRLSLELHGPAGILRVLGIAGNTPGMVSSMVDLDLSQHGEGTYFGRVRDIDSDEFVLEAPIAIERRSW